MKRRLWTIVITAVVLAGVWFIIGSLRKSAAPPEAGDPPLVASAPARVYGVVEPLGREVFVGAPAARRVVEIRVKEGDRVQQGEVICVLDHDVEEKAVAVARAKIGEARNKLALSEENLRRNANLYAEKAVRGSDVTDSELVVEYERAQLAVAEAQVALEQARLDELFLRAPVEGIVYKLDVRLGETLEPGDNKRIVLGSPKRQARLFVEVFWRDRVVPGAVFEVLDVETGGRIGKGTVTTVSPYLGRRDFRTEDAQERFDTKYQEVILELDSEDLPAPHVGLSVVAVLEPR